MKHHNIQYIIILFIAVLISSCASSEKIVYFQNLDGMNVKDTLMHFEPTIQVGDILAINVSAIDGEAALPFNIYETPIVGNITSNAKPLDYLVDVDGNIHFPVIGELKIEGLTTKSLNEK